MDYTVINRKVNFRSNYGQRINEKMVNISHISKEELAYLTKRSYILYERLPSYTDSLNYKRILNISSDIMKKQEEELIRKKKLDNMKNNAGYTLISIIVIMGIVIFSFLTFLLIRDMLH